ncbi:MAG: DNA ligase [Gammaproteobacteria bacterium]|nr:DNA ligase [Gammaproteobacteria bacterium]
MIKKRNSLTALLLLVFSITAHSSAPDLILLTPYKADMDIAGWLMSEKLDGVRAYWDGRDLYSRKGNRLAAPDWFTSKLPAFELDGELWIQRGRFEQTLSIISRDLPHSGWRNISYNIFEVPNAQGGLQKRLQKLQQYLDNKPVEHLRLIPQIVCQSKQHLDQHLKIIEQKGGEGLVLRNPQSLYETGRSPNALKVKSFDDMEGKVIGYKPGKGKYLGKTGSLWVEIDGGKRFYIGSGLTDNERTNPPPINSIITFTHQGFTVNGIPRFASFMRIRKLH